MAYDQNDVKLDCDPWADISTTVTPTMPAWGDETSQLISAKLML